MSTEQGWMRRRVGGMCEAQPAQSAHSAGAGSPASTCSVQSRGALDALPLRWGEPGNLPDF